MALESDLKLEIEQLRSELAISEKLESKSRERQLELEAQNAKMKKEQLLIVIHLSQPEKLKFTYYWPP